MRYLLLSSLLLVLTGCRTLYSHMKPVAGNAHQVTKLKPAFGVGKYRARVKVSGRRLSGLLVIKKMPDSAMRVVFTNEIGFTFFDFEWPAEQGFVIHSIIPQLNRKPVIKTLRKDFEGMMMNTVAAFSSNVRTDGNLLYTVLNSGKDYYYYVTDSTFTSLVRMERGGKRKKVLTVKMDAAEGKIPDSVTLHHHNFAFDIQLNKLDLDAKK